LARFGAVGPAAPLRANFALRAARDHSLTSYAWTDTSIDLELTAAA
jgi:hypothetical protein